jgi:hypothetical protein
MILLAYTACGGGKGGGLPPTDATGSGITCGGFAGTACPANEFCDFGRNTCGAADETGTCRARPAGCGRISEPSCGCDGVIYGNPCEANAAGVDVSDLGGCDVPAGQFACGHLFCQLDTQFCQRFGNDIGGEPDGFACTELPAACGSTPSCACLAGVACGENCEGAASTGFEVTCLGG